MHSNIISLTKFCFPAEYECDIIGCGATEYDAPRQP